MIFLVLLFWLQCATCYVKSGVESSTCRIMWGLKVFPELERLTVLTFKQAKWFIFTMEQLVLGNKLKSPVAPEQKILTNCAPWGKISYVEQQTRKKLFSWRDTVPANSNSRICPCLLGHSHWNHPASHSHENHSLFALLDWKKWWSPRWQQAWLILHSLLKQGSELPSLHT